jgi:hypothetical protein
MNIYLASLLHTSYNIPALIADLQGNNNGILDEAKSVNEIKSEGKTLQDLQNESRFLSITVKRVLNRDQWFALPGGSISGGEERVALAEDTEAILDKNGYVREGTLAEDTGFKRPSPNASGILPDSNDIPLKAGTVFVVDENGRIRSGTIGYGDPSVRLTQLNRSGITDWVRLKSGTGIVLDGNGIIRACTVADGTSLRKEDKFFISVSAGDFVEFDYRGFLYAVNGKKV